MGNNHAAFIGIGSNLGDRMANCEAAITLLSQDGGTKNIIKSKWYETKAVTEEAGSRKQEAGNGVKKRPMPFSDRQADYINGVVRIETSLSSADLLRLAQNIETKLGRVRTGKKWEPRTIDLDILFYDDLVIDAPDLKIPHPELHKRMFVLCPLCDIAPAFVHPVLDKTVEEIYENIYRQRGHQ